MSFLSLLMPPNQEGTLHAIEGKRGEGEGSGQHDQDFGQVKCLYSEDGFCRANQDEVVEKKPVTEITRQFVPGT